MGCYGCKAGYNEKLISYGGNGILKKQQYDDLRVCPTMGDTSNIMILPMAGRYSLGLFLVPQLILGQPNRDVLT